MNTKILLLNTSLKFILSSKGELNSINEVIKGMGYTKGAFFHYFKSKDDFYSQLFDLITKSALYEIQRILKRGKREPKQGLAELRRNLPPESRSDTAKLFYLYKICVQCSGVHTLIKQLENFEAQLTDIFEEFFSYHIRDNSGRKSKQLASTLILLIRGILTDSTGAWKNQYEDAFEIIEASL